MTEWQPIKTAPRDGTEILASDYDAIEIVSWGVQQGWQGWYDREGEITFPSWWQPFEPLFLVDIDSNGGNIGRFYWQNQSTLIVEQWGENNFYERTTTTLPGY